MKRVLNIVAFLIALMAVSDIYAQVPNIAYPQIQSFTVGKTITPVVPTNTGGAVPQTPFGQITVVAGSGTAGFANGIGTAAKFNAPYDVKVDASGTLYVADAGNNLIRKITPAGLVTTIAGTGVAGSADGANAAAQFFGPSGLAIDKFGNIFIADRKNHTIRKITAAGVVSTLAGKAGFTGTTNANGDFARFNLPTGIAVTPDGGLVVTDYGNNLVRQIGQDGSVGPIAGSGEDKSTDGNKRLAAFAKPTGIMVDNTGLIYMLDDSHIRTIDNNGNVVTIAGGFFSGRYDGSGLGAAFTRPVGIVKDAAGVLFIGDYGNNYIRRMDPIGSVDNIAPIGFDGPAGVSIDKNGVLYIADERSHVIKKMYTTGYSISPELPAGLIFDAATGIISGTPTQKLQSTNFIITAYNTTGRHVITSRIEVREANLMPQVITFPPLPTKAVGDPDLDPGATSSNNTIPLAYTSSDFAVAVIANGKILFRGPGKVTITATQRGSIDYAEAPPVSQEMEVLEAPDLAKPDVEALNGPFVFALDKFGKYTVKADQLAKITPGPQTPPLVVTIRPLADFTCDELGEQTITVGAGYGPDPADPLNATFNQPTNLSFDAAGNLYISDQGFHKVRKYDLSERVTLLAGGVSDYRDGVGPNAGFSENLLSLANDADGNTFVCDVKFNFVRKILPDGTTTTFATNALKAANNNRTFVPESIAIDRFNNIYVANRVQIFKVSPDGNTATLFAGSGQSVNQDGLGTAASFSGIVGMTFNKNGVLFVSTSDLTNGSSIRTITTAGMVTTFFGIPYQANFTRLVVDSKGNVFVASSQPKIYKITPSGELTNYAGNGTAGFADGRLERAMFRNPQGIAIDKDDNLYIADADNNRIRKITPAGRVTTIAGSGESGEKDNTYRSNAVKVKVQVTILSALGFKDTYADVTIPVTPNCPATVPDYVKDAVALSTCANKIVITQLPAANTPLVTGQPTIVTLTAKDNIGQTTEIKFNVTAVLQPPPIVNIALVTTNACDGAPVTYKATANAGSKATYQWLVNGTTATTGTSQFTSSTLKDGDRISCIAINNDLCTPVQSAPSDELIVSTQASIVTNVTISPSISGSVCPGVGITFTALADNVQTSAVGPTYQWQVNGINRGNGGATFTTTALADGDLVTCLMTSNVKCAALPVVTSEPFRVSIKTEEECSIKISTAFTPNGDGVNDYWEIPALYNYPDCGFSVYNRYGKIVFQSTGYSRPWDGNLNGNKIAAGTYYYLIDLKTGKAPLSGPVTIIR